MPSVLALRANQINQIVSNLQLSIFPVRWSSKQKRWVLSTGDSDTKLMKYLLFSLSWKILVALLCLVSILVTLQKQITSNIQPAVLSLLLFLFCGCSIMVDFVLVFYGQELVPCCNWLYEAENIWMRLKMDAWFSFKYASSKVSRFLVHSGKPSY